MAVFDGHQVRTSPPRIFFIQKWIQHPPASVCAEFVFSSPIGFLSFSFRFWFCGQPVYQIPFFGPALFQKINPRHSLPALWNSCSFQKTWINSQRYHSQKYFLWPFFLPVNLNRLRILPAGGDWSWTQFFSNPQGCAVAFIPVASDIGQ